MFSIILGAIIGLFEFLFLIIISVIETIITVITFIAKIIFNFIFKIIPLIFKFLINILSNLIKFVFKIILNLIKWIIKILKGLLKIFIKIIKSTFKWIKSFFSSTKSAATAKISKGALIAKKATVSTATATSLTLNPTLSSVKTHLNTPKTYKVNSVKTSTQKRIGTIERNLIKSAKKTKFAGKTVYKRDHLFDINQRDAQGRTNLQRMKEGLAPLDKNNKPIELHHLKQENSEIIEVTSAEHKENYKYLHRYKKNSVIDRKEFNKWKKQYWKERAKDFE